MKAIKMLRPCPRQNENNRQKASDGPVDNFPQNQLYSSAMTRYRCIAVASFVSNSRCRYLWELLKIGKQILKDLIVISRY